MTLVSASAFVDTFGDGMWMVGAGLFFVRAQGLPVTEVGIGLTIAGLIGLPAGIALARVADRRGPRGTYLALTLTQAAAFVALVASRTFVPFVVASAVAASANQGAQAIRSGIVRTMGGADAVRFRARLHAVMNVGISGGAAVAGLVIAANTRSAYVALMLADAGTFAVAGLLLRAASPVPAVVSPPGARRLGALRDSRYVAVAAADGLLDFEFIVSGFLLPLWVVLHTHAPRWLASPLLLLNTAIVVLFQVRFSNAATEPTGAARSYRRAGFALAAAAVMFGVSGRIPAVAAAALLVAAMAVHSLGELMHASGAFGLSYGLAPEHAVSEYQAVWSLGMGLARALGPAVLTFVCLRGGLVGWVALGLAFAVTGTAMPRLARRAGAPVAEQAEPPTVQLV
jgi:hypothetical protein